MPTDLRPYGATASNVRRSFICSCVIIVNYADVPFCKRIPQASGPGLGWDRGRRSPLYVCTDMYQKLPKINDEANDGLSKLNAAASCHTRSYK